MVGLLEPHYSFTKGLLSTEEATVTVLSRALEHQYDESKAVRFLVQKAVLAICSSQQTLIPLLDGHSSHYCPDTLKLAAENGVIITIYFPT